MARVPLFSIILIIVLGFGIHATAEGKVQVGDVEVSHIFGEDLLVHTTISPINQIKGVKIFFMSEDGSIISNEKATHSGSGEIDYVLDLTQIPLRPFSNIDIWIEVELADGVTVSSDPIRYFYDDNRFEWESITNQEFSIFWYQDDPNLGKEIQNTAYKGLAQIQNQVDVPTPDGIFIYAYADAGDMQDTLISTDGSTSWVAGHADPDIGVIVVSLPPGSEQYRELQRQIPHELTHVLLYKKIGQRYSSLPRWLNEGLASQFELNPNPDFQLLLDKAFERNALIPLYDLCNSFPIDAANFQLSYAESYSFTSYLQDKFGAKMIEELIQAYANGMNCDQAVLDVYKFSLIELDADWRQYRFNENPDDSLINTSEPLIIILGFAFIVPISLILIGISKFYWESNQMKNNQ